MSRDIFKINDVKELESELIDAREALRKFRFAAVQSKAKNIKEGRELRRDIARALTRINQLERK